MFFWFIWWKHEENFGVSDDEIIRGGVFENDVFKQKGYISVYSVLDLVPKDIIWTKTTIIPAGTLIVIQPRLKIKCGYINVTNNDASRAKANYSPLSDLSPNDYMSTKPIGEKNDKLPTPKELITPEEYGHSDEKNTNIFDKITALFDNGAGYIEAFMHIFIGKHLKEQYDTSSNWAYKYNKQNVEEPFWGRGVNYGEDLYLVFPEQQIRMSKDFRVTDIGANVKIRDTIAAKAQTQFNSSMLESTSVEDVKGKYISGFDIDEFNETVFWKLVEFCNLISNNSTDVLHEMHVDLNQFLASYDNDSVSTFDDAFNVLLSSLKSKEPCLADIIESLYTSPPLDSEGNVLEGNSNTIRTDDAWAIIDDGCGGLSYISPVTVVNGVHSFQEQDESGDVKWYSVLDDEWMSMSEINSILQPFDAMYYVVPGYYETASNGDIITYGKFGIPKLSLYAGWFNPIEDDLFHGELTEKDKNVIVYDTDVDENKVDTCNVYKNVITHESVISIGDKPILYKSDPETWYVINKVNTTYSTEYVVSDNFKLIPGLEKILIYDSDYSLKGFYIMYTEDELILITDGTYCIRTQNLCTNDEEVVVEIDEAPYFLTKDGYCIGFDTSEDFKELYSKMYGRDIPDDILGIVENYSVVGFIGPIH